MAKIRVGVNLHPQQLPYTQFAQAIAAIDSLGIDTIWNWDHFFPLDGNPETHPLEAWTLLSAMATLTRHAQIGCLVSCVSFRNASLIAAMARTVDHISAGRLILGLGAGWFERDFTEYGYPFDSATQRLETLEKALLIIKRRWQVDLPAPIRNPIPLLIGGAGENITLRLVAQHADIWNTFGPPDVYRRKNEVLNTWCAKLERDPAQIERSALIMPQDIPQLDRYLEAGATHIIVTLLEPWDVAIADQLVRWRDSLRD